MTVVGNKAIEEADVAYVMAWNGRLAATPSIDVMSTPSLGASTGSGDSPKQLSSMRRAQRDTAWAERPHLRRPCSRVEPSLTSARVGSRLIHHRPSHTGRIG
jgi:hypothetical protein